MEWSDLIGNQKYVGAIIHSEEGFGWRAIVQAIYLYNENRIQIIPMGGRVLQFDDESERWNFESWKFSGWEFSIPMATAPRQEGDVIKFEVSDLGSLTIYPVDVEVPYR